MSSRETAAKWRNIFASQTASNDPGNKGERFFIRGKIFLAPFSYFSLRRIPISRGGCNLQFLLCFELEVRDLINFVKSNATTWTTFNRMELITWKDSFFFLFYSLFLSITSMVGKVCS